MDGFFTSSPLKFSRPKYLERFEERRAADLLRREENSAADDPERRGDLVVLAVLEGPDVEEHPIALDAAEDARRAGAEPGGERFERHRRGTERHDLGGDLLRGDRSAAEFAEVGGHLEREARDPLQLRRQREGPLLALVDRHRDHAKGGELAEEAVAVQVELERRLEG